MPTCLPKKGGDLPEGISKATLTDEIANHNLDQMQLEIQVADVPKPIELQAGGGGEINIGSIFGDILPQKMKKRTVTVEEALKIFAAGGKRKTHRFGQRGKRSVAPCGKRTGVIFIDEMDKIAGKSSQNGPDVSREGVQRDILPIVEGLYRFHQVRAT